MPFSTHASASLFYTVQGPSTAPPLLLLHGWTCDSHDWSFQIPALVAQGLRVVALDLRGHGRSSAPEGSYSFDTLTGDIAALIRHLNLAPVVLVAHSMSTVLSSLIAVEHPELVRALVLLHPIYGLSSLQTMGAFHEKLKAMPEQAPEMTAAVFASIMFIPSTPAWIKTWVIRRVLGTPPQSIIGCLAGSAEAVGKFLGTHDSCKDFMRRRKGPRLAICTSREALEWEEQIGFGEQDEAVLVEEGTFLQLTVPEKVNGLMIAWLRKVGIIGSPYIGVVAKLS